MKSDLYTRLVLVIAAILVLTLVGSLSVAQQDIHWLLGKWSGEQWFGTGSSPNDRAIVEVVFRDESGKIQWELEVVSTTGRGFGAKAAGTATLSGESLSMRGQYTAGGPGLGAPVSYLLQRKGEDELTGTGLGRSQAGFNAAWKKIK